jgi:hypothetical protein
MRITTYVATLPLILGLTIPAAAEPPALGPVTHEELSRAFDELAGQIRGWGDRWRGHFTGSDPTERPLISIMLGYRQELGLSAGQVQELERLRADYQREAIKRDADLRVAEMDLAGLLKTDPVDLGRVEAKVREAERLRGDLRIGRIRTIEQGKAQLTPDQRAKLATLLGDPWPPRPHAGDRRGPRTPPARL